MSAIDDLDRNLALLRLHRELRVERRRRDDLLAGITPEERAFLDAERHRVLDQLRAENDQLEAELHRREELRLLEGRS